MSNDTGTLRARKGECDGDEEMLRRVVMDEKTVKVDEGMYEGREGDCCEWK